MRHFTLVNNGGKILNITTQEYFFHDIDGLGFEEENDFRQIGDFWMLNRTGLKQSTVSGSIMFTENGELDPYEKYWQFFRFINDAPLTLLYNPYGEFDVAVEDGEIKPNNDHTYFRTVRVSNLDKSEKNEYGVIDSSISFIAYTPWYTIFKKSFVIDTDVDTDGGWIWGDGGSNLPLVFEPGDSQSAIPAKFRYQVPQNYEIDLDEVSDCPTKITIYGPISEPVWTHSIVKDGIATIISTGKLTGVTISEEDQLIIDNTRGQYLIYRKNSNGTTANLYSQRDFGSRCFVNLKQGRNQITVSSNDVIVSNRLDIEGHMYYATV